jgi:S-formylglutathione hydrolase FrmB
MKATTPQRFAEAIEELAAHTSPVSLPFDARVNGQTFDCSRSFSGIGATGSTRTLRDFRFYVHMAGVALRLMSPVVALSLAFAVCVIAQTNTAGQVVFETVHSPAITGNLIGNIPERKIAIYLPPTYQKSSSRRYPVLYFLHGFADGYTMWTNGKPSIQSILDEAIGAGDVAEMIVVLPDVVGTYIGTYYTNSAAAGNWEDFIVRDLVGHIDSRYRTLAMPSRRGIAGHSMGGYGAIKLAMKHPDVFSVVYGLGPCCLGWVGRISPLDPGMAAALRLRSREELFALHAKLPELSNNDPEVFTIGFVALASAWSPNPAKAPLYVDLPAALEGGVLKPAEPAYSKWAANMPLSMASQYRGELKRLRAIGFDTGSSDEFADVVAGARALSAELGRLGIAHRFEEYDGNHSNRVRERMRNQLLPFVSRIIGASASEGP